MNPVQVATLRDAITLPEGQFTLLDTKVPASWSRGLVKNSRPFDFNARRPIPSGLYDPGIFADEDALGHIALPCAVEHPWCTGALLHCLPVAPAAMRPIKVWRTGGYLEHPITLAYSTLLSALRRHKLSHRPAAANEPGWVVVTNAIASLFGEMNFVKLAFSIVGCKDKSLAESLFHMEERDRIPGKPLLARLMAAGVVPDWEPKATWPEASRTRWWMPAEAGVAETLMESGETRGELREGPWVARYGNGQIASTGSYARGKENGDWSFWDVDGASRATGTFTLGHRTGTWKEWDRHRNYVCAYDGVRTGAATEMTDDRIYKGAYLAGLREGNWTAYLLLPDGRPGAVYSEGAYERGVRTGRWLYFYPEGQLRLSGSFVDGKRHGEWQSVTRSGQLRWTRTFVEGTDTANGGAAADEIDDTEDY